MWLTTTPAVGFASSSVTAQLLSGLLATCILLILIQKIRYALFGPLSRIPGSRWSAFTNIPQLYAVSVGQEVAAVNALHQRYGPIVRIQPDLIALIGDAQTWRQVYGFRSKDQQQWHKDLMFYDRPVNGTPGPITAVGQTHARMRKVLAKAFGDRAIKDYEPRLQIWAACLRNRLAKQAETKEPTDMVKVLNFATFDIMSDLSFAEPLHMLDDGEYVPWVKLVFGFLTLSTRLRAIRYLSSISNILLAIVIGRLPAIKRVMREHHRFISDRVDKRLKTSVAQPDIWSLITEDIEAPATLSLEEQYSVASELMIAGTETTATTLVGVMFYLLRNPHWMAMLAQELRSQYSSCNIPTLTSLQSNPTLNAVLHEGLRVYPPLPTGTPRIVPHGGAELKGYYLPENTRVAIYHHPTYTWEGNFRHPYEFRPERWLGYAEFQDDHLDAVQPFSLGPRDCVGKVNDIRSQERPTWLIIG